MDSHKIITRPCRALFKSTYMAFVFVLVSFSGQGYAEKLLPLSVEGSQVLVGDQARGLAGVGLFHSNESWGGRKYYNTEVFDWLANHWGTEVVRVPMGLMDVGDFENRVAANLPIVEQAIEAAIDHNLYVVVAWQSTQAEDHAPFAVPFFTHIAERYGHYNNIIYEVYAEPSHDDWSGAIKPYAELIIENIRHYDPDNLILVGTPFFGSDPERASLDPITTYENIAYNFGFSAASHGDAQRENVQAAVTNGIPLFATQWLSVEASGDGPVDEASVQLWMDLMKANNISYIAWALNDKLESTSLLLRNENGNQNESGGVSIDELTLSHSGHLALSYMYHQRDEGVPSNIETSAENGHEDEEDPSPVETPVPSQTVQPVPTSVPSPTPIATPSPEPAIPELETPEPEAPETDTPQASPLPSESEETMPEEIQENIEAPQFDLIQAETPAPTPLPTQPQMQSNQNLLTLDNSGGGSSHLAFIFALLSLLFATRKTFVKSK